MCHDFSTHAPVTRFVQKVNLGWSDKDASPLQNTYTADPRSPHVHAIAVAASDCSAGPTTMISEAASR